MTFGLGHLLMIYDVATNWPFFWPLFKKERRVKTYSRLERRIKGWEVGKSDLGRTASWATYSLHGGGRGLAVIFVVFPSWAIADDMLMIGMKMVVQFAKWQLLDIFLTSESLLKYQFNWERTPIQLGESNSLSKDFIQRKCNSNNWRNACNSLSQMSVFPHSPDVFSLYAVQDLPFYSKVDKIKIKLFPPPSLPPIFLLTTFATFEAEVGKVRWLFPCFHLRPSEAAPQQRSSCSKLFPPHRGRLWRFWLLGVDSNPSEPWSDTAHAG